VSLRVKDIFETLRGLRMEGRQTEELEALLVNTDDLRELFRNSRDNSGSIVHNHDEAHILGVKIIDTSYVPKGTILKVFKEDKPRLYPPGFGVNESVIHQQFGTPEHPVNIPGLSDIKTQYGIDPIQWEQSSDYEWKVYDSTEEEENIIRELPQPPVVVNEKKKKRKKRKKKKKHSQTRKIELD